MHLCLSVSSLPMRMSALDMVIASSTLLLFRAYLIRLEPNWSAEPALMIQFAPGPVREMEAAFLFLHSFCRYFRFQADVVEKCLQQLLQVVYTVFKSAHFSVCTMEGMTRKYQ